MVRIDFMGTPGIGKSYLIEHILNKTNTHLPFLSRRDALIQIARQNVTEYAFVYQTLIKIGLYLPIGDVALLLANLVNRKKEEEVFSKLSTIDQIIDQALIQYREFSQPALRKIKRVQGLYQQILDGVLISENPSDNIVLMDESLAQHLPDVDLELINNQPLLPNILVHVTGEVEHLVVHIREREKQKNKSPRNLDHTYLQLGLDYYTEKADRFSAAGVRVIHIDIKENISKNIDKILSTIKSVRNTNNKSLKIEN